jgi:hypothetical protein
LICALGSTFHWAHAQAKQLKDRKGLHCTAEGVNDQWGMLSRVFSCFEVILLLVNKNGDQEVVYRPLHNVGVPLVSTQSVR